MYSYIWKIVGLLSFICLIFVGATISSVAASKDLKIINKGGQNRSPIILRPQIQQTLTGPQAEDSPQQLFLPFVSVSEEPTIALVNAWMEDLSGRVANKFAPVEFVRYHASGTNSNEFAALANLNWTQEGPCGITTIFSDTVSLSPGEWEHSFVDIAPDCTGQYTNTVRIKHNGFESALSTQFEVSLPGTVVIGSGQAFDRCYLPSLGLMQAWWDNSPYSVFNIYLGGVSFFCSDNKVDRSWLQAASQQGWSFIPTWVGPQAPCSNFKHKMSSNASVAYHEGRAEADAAITEAQNLGMLDEYIIYYDMEGYQDNLSCRNTVSSFLRGWVERLHELGAKAGVYGSPCRSYIADWDSNDPKPDDVWIAHWYTNKYDPNASVFGTPCLSDSLWPNHQRIKQYAGDHTETWGGLSLGIDSNVLDGEIYQFPPNSLAGESIDNNLTVSKGTNIQDMAMISAESGWVLVDQNLYRTDDAGSEWIDIRPELVDGGQILSVHFLNDQHGWLLQKSRPSSGQAVLTLFKTDDGGKSWVEIVSNLSMGQDLPVYSASLEFIDDNNGWVSLKLQSSSNFSIGKLLATIDGGQNWTERSIPIGEPVRFINRNDGWTAGGPAGDQLYKTEDGGNSWQPFLLSLPGQKPGSRLLVGLPQFDRNQIGYLPITIVDGLESGLEVLISQDGGNTWMSGTSIDLTLDLEPAMPLPFSLNNDGSWIAVSTGKGDLYTYSNHEQPAEALPTVGLPEGVSSLDFYSDQSGWALVQEGKCEGHKILTGRLDETYLEPLICSQGSRLFSTDDGGRSWYDISPTY